MAERLTRTCATCNVSDPHAHHIQYVALNHPITGEPMDISVSKHIQCCASDGCEVCATDFVFAPDKAVGDGFTAYVQAKTPDHLAALADRHNISVPEGV